MDRSALFLVTIAVNAKCFLVTTHLDVPQRIAIELSGDFVYKLFELTNRHGILPGYCKHK